MQIVDQQVWGGGLWAKLWVTAEVLELLTFGTLLIFEALEGGRGGSGLCGTSSSGAKSGLRAKTLSRSIWREEDTTEDQVYASTATEGGKLLGAEPNRSGSAVLKLSRL